MILSHLNNIELKKNVLLNSDHNFCCYVTNFDFYQAILNECKKNLLNKEIKFDNISTQKKKQDDENIISVNFLVKNLLNVFNKNNIKTSFYIEKNTNIKKEHKKLDQHFKLKSYYSLKNKNKINIEENEKKIKMFKNNELLKHSKNITNKNISSYNYNIINCVKKSYSKSNLNESNNLKIIKNQKNSIKDSKNFIYFKNNLNNRSNILASKNAYKNQNSISEINSFKKTDENNFFKLNKKLTYILNNKKNLQWKKAISQQVLLSISNKENKAEIRLKPTFLGSIYVEIKIKDNQVKLKFISDHIEVKNFLNHCIPFLQDSLIKNGIFLKKVNISSFLNSKKNKHVFISKYIPRISNTIKKFHINLTQKKIVDMYV
ncbi:flagellar hook-length control protein FliK [Buchnera aphidicola]|uniref:flagellar hook-length control protein FliK n=1 Tax=Buchnera aphidicola TaxID=9 RepID=UPI00165130C3|nr:flagellar hook-length control protein FliK [Buchnera aphidicola]